MEIEDPTRLIAVVGPTGAGKSTFVKSLVGGDLVRIGHGLNSQTSSIEEWIVCHNRCEFILVDAPGFDDCDRDCKEVVERLLQWLAESYRDRKYFHGVIYIHSITDTRMQGTALQNLRMFQKLCGRTAMKNVVLATSFWDSVDLETGCRRESELISSGQFWGQIIAKGAGITRLGDPYRNFQVLEIMSTYEPVILCTQDEMANQGKSAAQTRAAQVNDANIEAEEKKYQELREKMQRDTEEEA